MRSSFTVAMTAPAYACPVRITGPSVRAMARFNAAMSSANEVRGIGAATTRSPSRARPRITYFQLEPSAHAPWTATTVIVPAIDTSRLPSAGSSRCGATRHGTLNEEFAHPLCDETAEVFKREMAGINQVQFRVRDISLIGLRPFDGEERIVLSPENQHSRLSTPKVLMPAIIESDIRSIVIKQLELNCSVFRAI